MSDWTFFSNYGHVLVCLSRNNEARLRDVAFEVGITERAVQKIVRDMQDAGFITVSKQGRCNRYRLNKRKSLRHGLESHCNIGKLLALVTRPDPIKIAAENHKEAKVQKPGISSRPRPVPEPAVKSSRQARLIPEPAQKSVAKVSKSNKKTSKQSHPTDSRQQGSLF
jgi:hypothetical protein